MFKYEERTVWSDVKMAGTFGFIGGYTSILSFLIFGVIVGCMSGNTVKMGLSLTQLDFMQFFKIFFTICSFIVGALIGTIVLNKFGHFTVLFLEGAILLLIGLQIFAIPYGVWAAAIAMGLQNALTTCISREKGRYVVRTTHVSGTCTDIGILIANRDKKGTIFFSFLLSFYLLGSLVGIIAFNLLSYQSFILGAAVVYGILIQQIVMKIISDDIIPSPSRNHRRKA